MVEAGARKRVGLAGARGYTGAELLRILAGHPGVEVVFATSGEHAGKPLSAVLDFWRGDLRFSAGEPDNARGLNLDVLFLALPNGQSAPWVEAAEKWNPAPVLIDLSADHRFDENWAYGLPELHRGSLQGTRRIANPGCYATAAQLALAPVVEWLSGPPHCFGVSGYSGAGATPSPRNDLKVLEGNLLPYQLAGHVHEREISHHLRAPVFFLPHVAPFFRGIGMTIGAAMKNPVQPTELMERFRSFYRGEPLIHVDGAMPTPRGAAGFAGARLGGFAVSGDGRHVAMVSAIDNLLKGAASQAAQNMNLALGFRELEGLDGLLAPPPFPLI
ncbi:MAG: N-acetyl-gamma-glutamyl-phosphate reductase [Myxococcota bacterium]|nr:N-acetyl-gamma-glutamyl-phosphate reductase [Myxococcota bacterium]